MYIYIFTDRVHPLFTPSHLMTKNIIIDEEQIIGECIPDSNFLQII
jgi:hypothetical protein